MGDYKPIALVLMLIIIGFKGTRAVICGTDGFAPCENGAACANDACACVAPFTGSLCSDVICGTDGFAPCENGAACANDACACVAPFTGSLCSDVICGTDGFAPCENGHACTDGACVCVAPFTGSLCNECVAPFTGSLCSDVICGTDGFAPCENGAACANDACACVAHFTGSLCSDDVDECTDLSPCDASNGICTNTVGSYTCSCNSGYVLGADGSACTATTPTTRMQGTLQCYSCLTNSITDVCSTADELASGSGVSTVTCYEEQRCWTDHYENSSHTVVSRGCTDDQCNTNHEGGGPYCTSANGVTSCTSCCTASKCNDNKSSSEGLTSSCVTWLTSLFSVIMIITYIYRT